MAAPTYTIDATWMAQVVQTAQWAMDAGLYAFVNTHHEADGNGGWVTFPADPTPVVAEVTAVWTQIATAFLAFDSHLMLECFNEPNEGGGGATTQAMTDLNQYLVACVNAIRGTGGANATRVIMIQGIGASPSQTGINSVLNISVIDDPNLIFSVHTYYPTNFGLSTTPYAWGSASDYTSMSSSVTQLLSWLPGWGVVIGEWGSESAQATANRVLHAHAYSRDTAAAGMCSMWWDNGGSYAIFNRTTGAETYPQLSMHSSPERKRALRVRVPTQRSPAPDELNHTQAALKAHIEPCPKKGMADCPREDPNPPRSLRRKVESPQGVVPPPKEEGHGGQQTD